MNTRLPHEQETVRIWTRVARRLGKLLVLSLMASAAGLRATAQPASPLPPVWVLHNEDPEFFDPPFDDFLRHYNSDGEESVTVTGFNLGSAIGAWRALAATPDGGVVAADFGSDVLLRFDARGEELFSIPISGMAAIEVAASGEMFGLLGSTIHGDGIVKLEADGAEVKRIRGGGVDLAVDDARGAVWVVGSTIQRYTLDLDRQWTRTPIGWTAVSVDLAADGSAWIAERSREQVHGSVDRLLQVSPAGEVLETIDLEYAPWCVRVDGEGSLWVSGGSCCPTSIETLERSRLHKYRPTGMELMSTPEIGAWSFAVDPSGGGLWVGCTADTRYYDLSGELLWTLPAFGRADQTWVSFAESGPHGTPEFIRGDCNGTGGNLDPLSNAVFLLNFNFLGGKEPPCLAACDVDGSGDVAGSVTDAVYLLTFGFLGGPPPVHPFPECGPLDQPTDLDLGCQETPGCR